jgi:hypothetical protein
MSEYRLPAPIQAQRVDNVAADRRPGVFKFFTAADGRVAGMNFRCPCPCARLTPIYFTGHECAGEPHWNWDGNRDAPTLSPSLHAVGHWHGYLRGGFFVQA